MKFRNWHLRRKVNSGVGVHVEQTHLPHGYLGDEFEGNLDKALENGVVFVDQNGNHIFYATNFQGELPDIAKFAEDMEGLKAPGG